MKKILMIPQESLAFLSLTACSPAGMAAILVWEVEEEAPAEDRGGRQMSLNRTPGLYDRHGMRVNGVGAITVLGMALLIKLFGSEPF